MDLLNLLLEMPIYNYHNKSEYGLMLYRNKSNELELSYVDIYNLNKRLTSIRGIKSPADLSIAIVDTLNILQTGEFIDSSMPFFAYENEAQKKIYIIEVGHTISPHRHGVKIFKADTLEELLYFIQGYVKGKYRREDHLNMIEYTRD